MLSVSATPSSDPTRSGARSPNSGSRSVVAGPTSATSSSVLLAAAGEVRLPTSTWAICLRAITPSAGVPAWRVSPCSMPLEPVQIAEDEDGMQVAAETDRGWEIGVKVLDRPVQPIQQLRQQALFQREAADGGAAHSP